MRIARAAVVALLVAFFVTFISESAAACDALGLAAGSCTTDGKTTDGGVEVTATTTTPAVKDSDSSTTTPSTTPAKPKKKTPPPPPQRNRGLNIDTATDGPTVTIVCLTPAACGTQPPVETVQEKPARGPVTLADIAAFHPVPGTTTMEPNGWAVVGLEANPSSSAVQHVVAGQLLGQAAEVRFSPTSWHWDYGDGGVRDSTSPGATWKSLRAAEFTRTATSHAYVEAGTFTITPSIRFAAEYRFAGADWTPVAGEVTVVGAAVSVDVATASTVLVGADCASDRSGPGC
ncbi:hypothetical protein BH11ACT2_BH11ACT2_09400 [soil metagenome]